MSTLEDTRQGGNGYVGQAIRRKEDPPLITGRGRYVDDIQLAGTLHAAIVRSPHAHARITSIDAGELEKRSDVQLVLTGEDLKDLAAPLPMAWAPPGVEVKTPDHWPLARGKVCHVGDPVAVVVADTKYGAVDAAEQIFVEYEELPVVIDPEKALEDGSPVIHEEFGTNHSYDWSLGGGDVEKALAEADIVVERRIVNHRTAGAAIEPRAAIAEWRAGYLTLYSTTQVPHLVRLQLAGVLGVAEDRFRVVAPDVGGGFGSKLNVYGEEALVAYLSRRLETPVRWTATRSEDMVAAVHGRDQITRGRMGLKRDGTIVAIHAHILADLGAYQQLLTPFIPSFGAFVMSGCYKIPSVRTDIVGVFTNKFPTDAIRGAGRPEATHLIEVLIEQAAAELGIDRIEIRRKNFIPKEDFPADVAPGVTYDSGDYHGSLDKMLANLDYEGFRAEQERAREEGRYLGIGFSTYMEICGLAPSRAVGPSGVGIQAGFWESAVVRVHPSGGATVWTGASPHGQGHDTGFAQIVADRIGVAPEQVEVVHGDTDRGPFGMGTYGSRSLAVGGESVARAALKVQDKARKIAAHLLEAAPEDVELADGKY